MQVKVTQVKVLGMEDPDSEVAAIATIGKMIASYTPGIWVIEGGNDDDIQKLAAIGITVERIPEE